jgi:hypothetical protein
MPAVTTLQRVPQCWELPAGARFHDMDSLYVDAFRNSLQSCLATISLNRLFDTNRHQENGLIQWRPPYSWFVWPAR